MIRVRCEGDEDGWCACESGEEYRRNTVLCFLASLKGLALMFMMVVHVERSVHKSATAEATDIHEREGAKREDN